MTRQLEGSTLSLLAASRNLVTWKDGKRVQPKFKKVHNQVDKKAC